ncbi:MAG: hypothetical protein WCA82_02150 [Jiangellales bacterium]
MRITRRAVLGLVATGALTTGLMVMPASALRLPPETEPASQQESQPSPAMTAGRAWCACHDVDYPMLWID